jgi:hypothetical protein
MGYSNFKKLQQVTEKFGLDSYTKNLFEAINPVQPSSWLLQSIEMAYIAPPTNEKSKSERLVSPVLLEVYQQYGEKISFFSGESIDINPQDDLSGPCDFFFALHPPTLYLQRPVISIAQAKDEDLEWGIAQCAAQMYAAHQFNIQHGDHFLPVLYGCATDGTAWHFLKFENNSIIIDRKPCTDLAQILGTWHYIFNFFL